MLKLKAKAELYTSSSLSPFELNSKHDKGKPTNNRSKLVFLTILYSNFRSSFDGPFLLADEAAPKTGLTWSKTGRIDPRAENSLKNGPIIIQEQFNWGNLNCSFTLQNVE